MAEKFLRTPEPLVLLQAIKIEKHSFNELMLDYKRKIIGKKGN